MYGLCPIHTTYGAYDAMFINTMLCRFSEKITCDVILLVLILKCSDVDIEKVWSKLASIIFFLNWGFLSPANNKAVSHESLYTLAPLDLTQLNDQAMSFCSLWLYNIVINNICLADLTSMSAFHPNTHFVLHPSEHIPTLTRMYKPACTALGKCWLFTE